MPTIVRNGSSGMDVSDANATTSQVLSGATFYSNASDDIQTGTMSNHGAKTINVGDTGSAGYYSSVSVNASSLGNATAAHVLSNVTFTNTSKMTQSGSIAIRGDPNASVAVGGTYINNDIGYYSKITVKGPILSGNATTDKVLSGYTFYKDSGEKLTGSLTSKTMSGTVGVGGTYTNTSAGYYTSVTVTGPTLSGNAIASDVLQDKTFYSSNGTKQTGTIIKRGSAICTSLAAGATYTGSAGYYDSISIKAAPAQTISLTGNATTSDVLAKKTFYSSSTTQQTGSLYKWAGDLNITTRWASVDLGFYPDAFGVGVSSGGTTTSTKCYVSGTYLHYCINQGSNHWGYGVAWAVY